jgi:hypothetical protein
MATKIFSGLIRLDKSTARGNRSEVTAVLHVNFYRQNFQDQALTIDLHQIDAGFEFTRIHFTGVVDQVGRSVTGQCADEVMRYWGHIPEIAKYCRLWERWNDNEKRIGTRDQTLALEGVFEIDFDDYEMWAKSYLSDVGLYSDRDYVWGSGKLIEIVPVEILSEIETVVENIRAYGPILKMKDCANA